MRLKDAKPRLSSVAPRLGYASGDKAAQNRSREAFAPWRAWYRTARWARLRTKVLVRDAYTCRRCGATRNSPELVADHIKPHRGDPVLFWCGEDGLQTLCSPCHGGAKQRQETRA